MEAVIALAIGVLGASGVWLILRPRTFQVIMGLSLLSYAVNLFIFSMGSLSMDREPIIAPGVPQDLLPHLFDPFVTTKPSGTGLGLALVAKIIDDHGGVVECESRPRRTLFRVMLPMHEDTEA